jgi:hypothetical protein
MLHAAAPWIDSRQLLLDNRFHILQQDCTNITAAPRQPKPTNGGEDLLRNARERSRSVCQRAGVLA